MIFALAMAAQGEQLHVYSSDFSYASEAEPHLGGDDYSISSVRVDYGGQRVVIANVTAFGKIRSLDIHRLADSATPRLPTAKPVPAAPAGGPMVEGGGPVGVAARGRSYLRVDVRTNEPKDPTVMRVDSAFIEFQNVLKSTAGHRLGKGGRGVYLQLRALDGNAESASVQLSRSEVKQDQILSNLFAAPFAYLPIGSASRLGALNSVLKLETGRSQPLGLEGRLYVVTRYDLN